MTFLLALIALPGIAAVLLRWSRAMFVTARHALERFVAKQIADKRAERGDLSGLTEAEALRRKSAEAARQALLRLLFWSALLIGPIFLPGTFLIYTLYGALWLLPRGKQVTRT